MIRIIAAVSNNGIIGQNNNLPWLGKYPEDMKFFRKMTTNSAIIYGRNTFESLQCKPLPKRRNIVISSKYIAEENLETFASLGVAIETAAFTHKDVWLIGGSSIYREGMKFTDEIYLTLIPEEIKGDSLVSFPWIDPTRFALSELIQIENSELQVAKYTKI